ncbi:hypothetical protein l13_00630 [Neisseria weaveri ATCC 51223]|nr:hypothetical protein l13_00630 [Neisseria weaveri ATCC 51223]
MGGSAHSFWRAEIKAAFIQTVGRLKIQTAFLSFVSFTRLYFKSNTVYYLIEPAIRNYKGRLNFQTACAQHKNKYTAIHQPAGRG